MPNLEPTLPLLEVVLDAWDRSNEILLNLLENIPAGHLTARAMEGSPAIAEMFLHMHHERMVTVLEEAPEFAGEVPEKEWAMELDPARIARLLTESAGRVRQAVQSRVEAGRQTDLDYDHPILLLQLLMFHEAYHHGQIKLALKASGHRLPDELVGALTWGVWRKRR